MMELLRLFWVFFKLGLFTVGGGYAIVPLLQQELAARGLMTVNETLDMVGISQMTPGPLAVNAATFAGMRTYGVAGAVAATLGVTLPGICLSLLVANFFFAHVRRPGVQAALGGVRPVVMALILTSALSVARETAWTGSSVAWTEAAIIAACLIVLFTVKKVSPVILICICGVIGAFFLR